MSSAGIDERTLVAAARVIGLLEERGVKCALVGAAALAAHGYSRATEDIDIGVAVTSLAELQRIGVEIGALLQAEATVALPDAEDPLGGVITVRRDDLRQIQIVNFLNPIGTGDHPGREGVTHGVALKIAGAPASVVDLAHLVAMKLFAGGLKSKADVVELLTYNPDADLDAIAALCGRFGLADAWTALLPEIVARRTP